MQDLLRAFDLVDGADELHAALLVNQAIDDSVNHDDIRRQVDELGSQCTGLPWDYLAQSGFCGNRGDYASPRNSCISAVLEDRIGIPISLGVLLIHVARSSGRRAHGVNFPGHFLVQVEDTLIDPFDMVATTSSERLAAIDPDQRTTQAFEPISASAIAVRMLNNVKYQYARDHQWEQVLKMLSCQCALLPTEAVFHFERGEIWRQLGSDDAARDSYVSALTHATDAGVIKACHKRMSQIRPGEGRGPGAGQVH